MIVLHPQHRLQNGLRFSAGKLRSKQAFEGLLDDKRLTMRLETLALDCTGFLNLHWILQAMDVLLMSQSEVQQLLPPASTCALRKERNWMSVFLDDNAKLLEVCNIVKQGMSRVGHSRMHVKYVLRLLDVSQGGSYNEARLFKARKALQECLDTGFMVGGKTNEHTGSWLLQDISHRLLVAKNVDAARKTKIASKAYEANIVSVVVLGALLVVLPCEAAGEVPVALQFSVEQQPWASAALLELQQGIREEAQCRNGGLLEGVYSSLRQVVSLVDSWLSRGRFPLPRGDEDRMKQALHQAAKKFDSVQSGLELLEEQTTALFRKLIVNRNLLLSACHED